MDRKNDKNSQEEKPIESYRKSKKKKIASLSGYRHNYSVDAFLEDLVNYFEGEVDFNLQKIREYLESRFVLENLIITAKNNDTHPVTEFLLEFFKDLGKSGDVKWSGEL